MKQYMVVRLAAEQLGNVLSVIPLTGLFGWGAAEAVVEKARAAEPGAVFLIQEVGVA